MTPEAQRRRGLLPVRKDRLQEPPPDHADVQHLTPAQCLAKVHELIVPPRRSKESRLLTSDYKDTLSDLSAEFLAVGTFAMAAHRSLPARHGRHRRLDSPAPRERSTSLASAGRIRCPVVWLTTGRAD